MSKSTSRLRRKAAPTGRFRSANRRSKQERSWDRAPSWGMLGLARQARSPIASGRDRRHFGRRTMSAAAQPSAAPPSRAAHLTDLETMPIAQVLVRLDVTADKGLTEDAARKRLAQYGPNALPEP